MAAKYSLSMVFPAYNEQDNVEKLVQDADTLGRDVFGEDYEVIVVDDGSKDKTPEILARLKTRYPRLVVYTHSPNRGYTAALRTGFTNAKKDLIFYSDADNQFDLSEIPLLLEKIDDNDIVSGYRNPRIDPWIRIFVSRCFNIMSHTIFKFPIRDVDCAFKLFRREVFDKIKINSDNFMVDTEIMAKAVLFKMRVAEVGVTHLPRQAGETTVKPSDVFKTLRGMWKLWFELRDLKR
ncbi:MAG TPA: glycosyltransferase family 2 protein [bacterium]|nr:glycosyltransferase family 2 protein [bacterium]